MNLIILADGRVRCIYDEAIALSAIGELHITRASHVEADEAGRWWAHLTPVSGPTLGPFDLRSQALAAEIDWLGEHLPHL